MSNLEPLDLNNLPEDHHDKQSSLNLSSTLPPGIGRGGGYKKRKNEAMDDGIGSKKKSVYRCRFCSLTFFKSQSLGGHMNRHRQERGEETLNRARQLVFCKDNFYKLGNQGMVHGGYEHQGSSYNIYGGSPTTLFSTAQVLVNPHLPSLGIPTNYSTVMGHVYSGNNPQLVTYALQSNGVNNHTRIGSEQGFTMSGESGGGSCSRHVTD